MGALSHLRVLDLSRVLAGPWASQILADLGADVIKIERPDSGDDTRAWGPPWMEDPQWGDERQSAYFVGVNRNKRSVAIDIGDPRGSELVRTLATKCDVLLENFKVGGLGKYGLDYASLQEINPRLIYCSITGFGQSGPYAHRPGYDFLIQGMGGLMSVTGRPDGDAGDGPLKTGVALTDILTGLYATVGIQAALIHRDKTGKGQHIDTALMDVQVACLANQAMNYLASGTSPSRLGNGHPNIVPYQDFRTKDGYIIITVGNEGQFRRLCEVLRLPHLLEDPRFTSNSARIAHRDPLITQLQDALLTGTSSEWLAELEKNNVPCGPINDLAGVFADPHVVHRGLKVNLSTEDAGPVSVVASPLRLSESPVEYRSGPPRLGSHTAEVLAGLLGVGAETLSALEFARVVRTQ